MEIDCGFVGGRKEGGRHILSAESPDHSAGLQRAVSDLQEVVVGFGGEVEELNMSSWEKGQ